MNVDQVIKHYKGMTHAAAELRKSPQCIQNWKDAWDEKQKPLSYWNQCAIAYLSDGALKVDRK